jgi:hypothetical protein
MWSFGDFVESQIIDDLENSPNAATGNGLSIFQRQGPNPDQ